MIVMRLNADLSCGRENCPQPLRIKGMDSAYNSKKTKMEENFAGANVGSKCLVAFQDERGSKMQGLVRRPAHFQAVFEVCGPLTSYRVSEVLKNFKVLTTGRPPMVDPQ
jgi:hypothetical protein